MDLEQYKRRLVKIWLFGVVALTALIGIVKWRAYQEGAATDPTKEILTTLGISLFLPTLVIVRGYYRYKKYLNDPHE